MNMLPPAIRFRRREELRLLEPCRPGEAKERQCQTENAWQRSAPLRRARPAKRRGSLADSPAYLVTGVFMVLALMVSPSMVPINSTCWPA